MTERLARWSVLAMVLSASLPLTGCSSPPESASWSAEQRAKRSTDSTASFVNRVWKVSKSSGGSPGSLYVFLSDSTLLITSSHGTPMLGRWSYHRDTLTLIEEGIAHPATVLGLGRDEFSLRVYHPGGSVELTFVPAAVTRSPRSVGPPPNSTRVRASPKQ